MEIKETRDVITKVSNKDAVFLHGKIMRMKTEVALSVTAQGHEAIEADLTRFSSFVADLRGGLQHVQAKPEIDASKYAPGSFLIQDFGEVPTVENDICQDFLIELKMMDYQMVASGSAQRRLVGFNKYDETRLVEGLDRLELKLKHLAAYKPLDLQESAPTVPQTGHGAQQS